MAATPKQNKSIEAGRRNMRPYQLDPTRTQAEIKEIQIKAGKKSGETRRKKAEFKDRLRLLMEMPVTDEDVKLNFKKIGIDNPDNYDMVTRALWVQASLGDVAAQKYLDEKMGLNPSLKLKEREIALKEKLAQEDPSEFEDDGFLSALNGFEVKWDDENEEDSTV